MPFSGRIRHKALVPGRYRWTLVATDAAGNRSQAEAGRLQDRQIGLELTRRHRAVTPPHAGESGAVSLPNIFRRWARGSSF